MEPSFRQWLIDRDEPAIDDAFFDDECPHFFAVDWREDPADFVQACGDCLDGADVRADWQGDLLLIIRDGNETTVSLMDDDGDQDLAIRTLNEALQPDYEIRLLACSHGSDTAGFAVLPTADWESLDSELSQAVNENFVALAALPNLFTEMTEEHLPEAARLRFERMMERNRQR
ncbi:hypothetical protein [Blastopirellula retiformator]|uniref:Uncharacterized protein n=1 Tax=Blastopirellula retiformator TaxID=2527970 RepID=A0A5C5UX67_9BACT|nr:hypothetical protein [Blastopirellula retiformator]TWT29975.1 hypothetical protein Enr8_46320 [Blastopirellula retiformator]